MLCSVYTSIAGEYNGVFEHRILKIANSSCLKKPRKRRVEKEEVLDINLYKK